VRNRVTELFGHETLEDIVQKFVQVSISRIPRFGRNFFLDKFLSLVFARKYHPNTTGKNLSENYELNYIIYVMALKRLLEPYLLSWRWPVLRFVGKLRPREIRKIGPRSATIATSSKSSSRDASLKIGCAKSSAPG
jgi:hypothetical protein